MSSALRTLWASLFCLALPTAAHGQAPSSTAPVGEAPPTALPDVMFQAVGDRPVVVHLTDGRQVKVRILAVQSDRIVIGLLASGEVRLVSRDTVTTVRLLGSEAPTDCACVEVQPPPPPRRPRYLGASISLLPGFTLDLDVRRFRAFANVGILLPSATNGGFIPLSIGLGAGLPLWRGMPGLKLDLFAHMNWVGDLHGDSDFGFHGGNWLAFGVGIGLHRTWDNGLTMGFALPVLGYSFVIGPSPFPRNTSVPTNFGYYYATSAEALPLFYIGYRR